MNHTAVITKFCDLITTVHRDRAASIVLDGAGEVQARTPASLDCRETVLVEKSLAGYLGPAGYYAEEYRSWLEERVAQDLTAALEAKP